MPEPEIAYLLTGEELLLLFSLVDQRPVVAFALPDPAQVPSERWAQIAVDLHRKGMANYTEAGVVPAASVAELLTAMKDADTVCLALSRDAASKTQALYQSGGQAVLLQGNYWPGYRLETWNAPPAHWLDTCLGLPKRVSAHSYNPTEPSPFSTQPYPSLGDPPSCWGQWEQARVILDVYRGGQLSHRLVWWQETAGCTVLCQSETGIRLFPDCRDTRNTLQRHLWEGGPL